MHFDKLDDLHVSISSSNPKGKFDTKLPNISVSESSNFQVQIFEPGLYSLYIWAPYHDGSLLSFLVDRPDSIIVDIEMNAIAVEDGEFFPDPEYVRWIDVMGNFNDWDSETAIPFTFDAADSSIYCIIPSNLDTVWYRIYGLNTMVLPGADAYKITRVQGREGYIAALIPENGEVVLRYRPGEYPFPKPKGHRYERLLYYQPEKWIPTYFSFKEKIHEDAVIQLLKTSQLHSGFSRVSDSRYLVQGPFTRFDTVLDSVFQSVKT